MWVQFDEVISCATGQLEIECFEQTLIASCAGNHKSDMFVRNFYTTEFDSFFSNAVLLSTIRE